MGATVTTAPDVTVAQSEPACGRRTISAAEKDAAKVTILARLREGQELAPAARGVLADGGDVGGPQVWRWRQVDPAFGAAYDEAWATGAERRFVTASARAKRVLAETRKKRHPLPSPVRRAPPPRPAPGGKRPPWVPWSREEDALVRRLAGEYTPTEIAARIDAEFWTRRTARAVIRRGQNLDLSLAIRHWTLGQIAALLGCGFKALQTCHLDGTILLGRQGRRRNEPAWAHTAEVERLIRERPWLYNPARLGKGRLADLGRTLHRADPWLTAGEVAVVLGCSAFAVERHWQKGRLPFRWRRFGTPKPQRVTQRSDALRYARNQLRKGA